MINKVLFVSFIVLIMCVPQMAEAQAHYSRYSASLGWEPIDDLQMELTPEIHLEDFQEPSEWLITYGLEYKLFSFLEVGGSVRWNTEYKDCEPVSSVRYSGDMDIKVPVKRFEFNVRSRVSNYAEYGEELEKHNAYRSRFKMEYDIRKCKLTPNIYGELFFTPKGFDLSKIRYGFGVDWNLPKRNSIEAGYFFQTYPGRTKRVQVFELNWSYRIKNGIKR